MALKIVDDAKQLETAFESLEATLLAWAGGRAEHWQEEGRNGPTEAGSSFARREDVYIFLHRSQREATVGVALSERDRDLVRISLPRQEPHKHRKSAALALDESGAAFLLIAVDELKRQGIRDPLKRLSGAPQIKRANVADRDYVLVGPLDEVLVAEALLALSALHPLFERHIDKLGALAGASDALDDTELYRPSPRVAKLHRLHGRVVSALFQKLRERGFDKDELRAGSFRADFAMRRRELAIAFEIRVAADLEDILKSIGQLMLVAPKPSGVQRCIVLPTSREALGSSLAVFEPVLQEANAMVLLYDFKDGAFEFWPQIVPTGAPPDLIQVLRS